MGKGSGTKCDRPPMEVGATPETTPPPASQDGTQNMWMPAGLDKLGEGESLNIDGARVERRSDRWLVHVKGMPTISCVHASQAVQQAVGANQVQTPGKSGSLSSVDEGQVRLERVQLRERTDQELEELTDSFLASSRQDTRHRLYGLALAREMNERKVQERKRVWEEKDAAEKRERQAKWQAMLEEQTPAAERVAAVQRGYSDARGGDYTRRELRFHRRFDPAEWRSAQEAIRAIGPYNNFQAARVIEKLDSVRDRLDGIVVGREMSPVVFALLPKDATVEERRDIGIAFLTAMGAAKADELSFSYANGGHDFDWETGSEDADQVRAWWD